MLAERQHWRQRQISATREGVHILGGSLMRPCYQFLTLSRHLQQQQQKQISATREGVPILGGSLILECCPLLVLTPQSLQDKPAVHGKGATTAMSLL